MDSIFKDYLPHRALSIRTRIKTFYHQFYIENYTSLTEHYPLEQGLRPPSSLTSLTSLRTLIEHYPLEQGLRPPLVLRNNKSVSYLIEHYPLEQGLRHDGCHIL